MKRRLFSLLLVMVMILSSLTIQAQHNEENESENDGTFSDVAESHWAYDYIKIMSKLDIISGYQGKFYPDDNVSRDEFSKMMVLTLQLDLIKPSTATFSDVTAKDWSYKYVETARGYLTGYGDYFYPKRDADREDLAYAVVKALGISTEDADLSLLDDYEDADQISTVLLPYVAKAVEEEIMIGSNGELNPREGIKRAEAATLLARLITSEKVIFDEAKTIYEDAVVVEEGSKTPTLSATVKDEKVYLDWTGVQSSGFKYYKVVTSFGNSTPIYPEDGYVQAIGNVNTTDTYIKPNQNINNGDTDLLIPGKTYHVSITAVYEDNKYASNTVDVVIPDADELDESDRTPTLSYTINDGGLKLSWTTPDDDDFKYYKVVYSTTDNTPVYPGDGYLTYINGVNNTSYVAYAGKGYNGNQIDKITSGTKYYVSITAVYNNGSKYYPSNTITVNQP